MVKAGSIYESVATNGLSHFLEHMFFKWWIQYQTPKAVAETIDRIGGEFNAYTADEYASYYVKCSPEHSMTAIDVLADMMVNAQFPVPELEREKQVVIQEIKMYEDNPQSLVYQRWKPWFLWDNSYGWPIIGTEANVLAFTQDDLFSHKQRYYTKDNLIVVISWSIIDSERLLDSIGNLFGPLPAFSDYVLTPYVTTLPSVRQASFVKQSEQTHLIVSSPGFVYRDDRKYAASLLATILGGNMSSRLFQHIREKLGLCYYIGASHFAESYAGYFLCRAGLDKKQFDLGLDAIYREIDHMVQWDISQTDFDNAQWFKLWKLQLWIETSDDVAEFLGTQYLLYDTIVTIEDLIAQYQSVSLRDVQDLASCLSKDKLYAFSIQ